MLIFKKNNTKSKRMFVFRWFMNEIRKNNKEGYSFKMQ